jgi:uncharacterized protein (DUF983 family)
MSTQTIISETKICNCKKQTNFNSPVSKSKFPFVLSLFIALLPKCPFCIFGYTSVMAMCSGTTIESHKAGNTVAYLPLLLSTFVVVSLLMNFKGKKTWYALSLALFGTLLINWSALWTGNLMAYFSGSFSLFLSIFINGSFAFFWRNLKQKFTSQIA